MKKEKVQKIEEPKDVSVSTTTVDEKETDYKDLYLRTLADMDNLRKNTTKKINDIYLAVNNENIKLDEETYSEGYEVLKKQFENILSKFGLKEIEVHEDDDFDESIMNAIAIAPTGDKKSDNKVCDITKKGYTLNDIVIRYADVVVYKYNK